MSRPPNKLVEILHECSREGLISWDGKTLRFKFDPKARLHLEEELTGFNVENKFFPNDECEIILNVEYNHKTVFFLNEKEFLNRVESFQSEFHEFTFAIISYQGQYLVKLPNESFSEPKAIFFNTIAYRNLIDVISKSSNFISFHDENEQRLLIVSLDKGPFFIGYNRNDSRIQALPNLQPFVERLANAFLRIDYVAFFKDAVLEGVHKSDEADRFYDMVKSLQVLMDITERDHNLYLKQFGFEKIKAKFKEERVKYFENIEKNIESISKQVTSFPLTFAASVFASYQVRDKSFILFMIFGAYLLYTIIAWRILDVIAFNRQKISEDLEGEKHNIQTGYQILYVDFQPDFEKIETKVIKLKDLIVLLRIILLALLLGFGLFSWQQYKKAQSVATNVVEVKTK